MGYKLSQEFKDFMIDLKEWVDSDCPYPYECALAKEKGFQRCDSICYQVYRWEGCQDDEIREKVTRDLNYLLSEQFAYPCYPFNKVEGEEYQGSSEYRREVEEATHYQNPARLKWINDTVASFYTDAL